jgi:hypothetical protein
MSSILNEIGGDYSTLIGVIICIPEFLVQPVSGESKCFFIKNPHTSIETPTPLRRIEGIPNSEFIVAPFLIELYFKAQKGWNKLTLPAPQFLPFEAIEYFK